MRGHARLHIVRRRPANWQNDGYNCGVFSIKACELIADELLQGKALDAVAVGSIDAGEVRGETLQSIPQRAKAVTEVAGKDLTKPDSQSMYDYGSLPQFEGGDDYETCDDTLAVASHKRPGQGGQGYDYGHPPSVRRV